MATGLRSSGKIYVVVAVISIIFIGLLAYLFSIDKRLKKIESEIKHWNDTLNLFKYGFSGLTHPCYGYTKNISFAGIPFFNSNLQH